MDELREQLQALVDEGAGYIETWLVPVFEAFNNIEGVTPIDFIDGA